jgi:transposase
VRAAVEHRACQRLMRIPGVEVITATAVIAAIGTGAEFRKGRGFAAWLGLVPGQYSTGGKEKLLGISKQGNCYLRRLFVNGHAPFCGARTSNHPVYLPGSPGLGDMRTIT